MDSLENVEHETNIEEFFELSIDLLCITDSNGIFLKLSPSWSKLTGYELYELIGKDFISFVHPDDIVATVHTLNSLNKYNDVLLFTNRYRCKNGDYKYIEWNSRKSDNKIIAVARDITCKINAEKTLNDTKWFLEQAQIIANLGCYDFDIVNDRWTSTETLNKLLGIEAAFEKSFESWLSLVDPDYQKIMLNYFTNEVIGNKKQFDKQYVIKKFSNGEKRWVHGLGEVYYDSEGNPTRMIGTIKDIHDQKVFDDYRNAIESSLYQEKERLKITFDSIGDGVVTTDNNSVVTYLNISAEKITGWTLSDAINKKFSEIFVIHNETTGNKARDPIVEVLETDKICELENHAILTAKDGQKYHIADSAAPIKDLNGTTTGVVMIFRDVTEKKEAEKILRQSNEIIEKMQTGIYIYKLEDFSNDASLRLVSANEASTSILGIRKEEIIDKFIDEIFPRLRENDIPHKFADVVRTGQSIEIEDFSYNDQNIVESCFSFKALRIQQDQVCVLFDNITEKRKYLEEIKFISFHDILTGLNNRAYMVKNLSNVDVESCYPIAVILGDVNGLKLINDVYGHEKGDELLKVISNILVRCCPERAMIARWGGDEFKIVIPNTSIEEANEIIYKIKQDCTKNWFESIIPSISLGASIKSATTENLNDTFREAENRMYTHKLIEGKSIRNSIITSLQRALFEKSCETEEHATRMMDLAAKMGDKMSLSQYELDEMHLLTVLHDIGKMGISNSILNKAGALSIKEWYEVKKHPEIGYRIAQAITELSRISDLILSHHEHWDGTGYPQGLKGDSIPKLVRILSIIDAYDVMTNGRPYKDPVSKENALLELEKYAGTQFDPVLVKEFVEMMRE